MNDKNDNGTDISTEQALEIGKKKRGSKWMQELTDTGGGTMKPGENSQFVRHAIASWDLPPIDISDPEQVKNRIGMYFDYCSKNDRRPQVVGLCNWLGISRDTLNSWVRGEYRSDTHSDIIKKAFSMIEEMWTDFMLYGKVNPPTGIFLSKNWFNYRDVADVVVTPNNPMQDLDADTARKRLTDAIPVDDDE